MTNTGWFTIALRLAFILGCVAVAQESVVLNFYPEVPVTSYRQITKLEFKFPKVTSSTSDGSAVDPRWVQNIKEALDGAQVELKDEFTQTFEALQNDASLPVTTNGIVTRTTTRQGTSTSITAPYRHKTVYQNEGAIFLSNFRYDTSQLAPANVQIIQQEQALVESFRNTNLVRLYGLPLNVGVSTTLSPNNALFLFDTDMKSTFTYRTHLVSTQPAANRFSINLTKQRSILHFA